KTTRVSRRRFLAQSAASGVATLGFPAIVRSAAPNGRLNVAFIGVGGRGRHNLGELAGKKAESIGVPVNVVAICDVDARSLDIAAHDYPNARKYADFRKLYDEAKDVDAFVVSTTEHTHAYATMPA